MSEQTDRVQRYADALAAHSQSYEPADLPNAHHGYAAAVMAVADAEQAELRAENEAAYADFTTMSEHAASLDHRLQAAERALADERAKVAAIPGAVDWMRRIFGSEVADAMEEALRQALARPEPETTGPCADCGHIHSPEGCTGPPTPSDLWAGVSPAVCDCDAEPETSEGGSGE